MLEQEQREFESLSLNSKNPLQLDVLTRNNIGQLEIILKHSGLKIDSEAPKWLEMDSQLGYFNDLCVSGIVSKQVGHVVEILFCVVLKAYQRQGKSIALILGLGSLLVQDLIKKKREFKPSLLETQPTEIKVKAVGETAAFWKKMGFTQRNDVMVMKILK